jgi:tetratricopeptide (TPR) repeat protein
MFWEGVRSSSEMDEFFKELFGKASDIIHEAGQSPLALASLGVLILGALGFLFFRDATAKFKLAAFATITIGFIGLFVYANNPVRPQPDKVAAILAEGARLYFGGQTDQARAAYAEAVAAFNRSGNSLGQAKVLKGLADFERILGHYGQARSAYGKALALFRKLDDRLAQAYVLKALGDMESILGNNDQAREDYDQAYSLYKQQDYILGQANLLYALSCLVSRNPQQASVYRDAFAQLYARINFGQ